MKSRQAYWSAKEYLMWEFLIGTAGEILNPMLNKECTNKIWAHFLLGFCNILETRLNSDQIKNKHRWTFSSYLWGPSFGFGGTLDFPGWHIPATPKNHFSPPMNQIYLHCLPPDADLHAGFIWQNAIPAIGGRRCHQRNICTPEREIEGQILQPTNPTEEGLGLPQVVKKTLKKVPKKVILLKSTGESTQKFTQKSAQVKKD